MVPGVGCWRDAKESKWTAPGDGLDIEVREREAFRVTPRFVAHAIGYN